jgi:hypothetical protein
VATLTNNWIAAFSQAATPSVYKVEIVIDGTTTLRAINAYSSVLTYPVSVASVAGVSSTLDIFERKISAAKASVTFVPDGLARSWIIGYRLKGKLIRITLGATALAAVDYASVFVGVIDEAEIRADGVVELKCLNALGYLRGLRATLPGKYFVCKHPAQVMVEILVASGLHTDLYNTDSFAPGEGQFDSIAHFAASTRLDDELKTVDALEALEQLALLMDAALIVSDEGVLTCQVYNPAASVSDTWTEDDFDADSLEIVEMEGNAINEVTVDMAPGGTDQSQYKTIDAASQTALAAYGATKKVCAKEFESKWINATAILSGANLASGTGVGGTFNVVYAQGLCGSVWEGYPDLAQATYAPLSAAKPAYLRLVLRGNEKSEPSEVIKVTASSASAVDYQTENSEDGVTSTDEYSVHAIQYTIAARGAVPLTWEKDKTLVQDVTIARHIGESLVSRHGYGTPVIRLRTNMLKHSIVPGNFVAVVTPRYAAYGDDGLTTATKWEVIGKDVQGEGADVGITWTLAKVYKTTPPAPTLTYAGWRPGRPGLGVNVAGSIFDRAVHSYKVTGGAASIGTGLTVDVAELTVDVGSTRTRMPARTVRVLASKDSYLHFNPRTKLYGVQAVANGAAAPTQSPDVVLLAKAVSGAATVSLVTNYTSTEAFAASVVTETAIGPLAVTEGKLGALAVTEGKLGALAVTEGKLGALAVTSGKIGELAVSTGKVAHNAVAPIKIAAGDAPAVSLVRNATFTKYTRG